MLFRQAVCRLMFDDKIKMLLLYPSQKQSFKPYF